MNEFSKRFKSLREARGLTQEEAAEQLGISRSTIAGYESEEKNRVPRKEVLNKIADLFGTTIDYLLGRDNEENTLREPSIYERRLTTERSLSEKYGFNLEDDEDRAIVDELLRTAARIKGYKFVDK